MQLMKRSYSTVNPVISLEEDHPRRDLGLGAGRDPSPLLWRARLAGAVRTYLHDPELRRRHGAAARAWVLGNFQREPIWQAVYQEYVQCLLMKGLTLNGKNPFPGGESGQADPPREQWS